MKKIRSYFITGILAIMPVFLTFIILAKMVGYFISMISYFIPLNFISKKIIEHYGSFSLIFNSALVFVIYLVSIFISCIVIVFLGITARHYIDRINWIEQIFNKIPLFKPIYSTLRQISKAVSSQKHSSYNKVVIVEYPQKGNFSLGFLSNDNSVKLKKLINIDELVTVFIPHSPNIASGVWLLLEKSKVIEVNMKIEDALKLIVSGGAILPENFN